MPIPQFHRDSTAAVYIQEVQLLIGLIALNENLQIEIQRPITTCRDSCNQNLQIIACNSV